MSTGTFNVDIQVQVNLVLDIQSSLEKNGHFYGHSPKPHQTLGIIAGIDSYGHSATIPCPGDPLSSKNSQRTRCFLHKLPSE